MPVRESFVLPHSATPGGSDRVQLSCLLAGPDPRTQSDSTLVVLVHGFPELAFSWRNQIDALGNQGCWSCVAPDMRGYGESSVPKDTTAYAFEYVCQDLVALVKALKRTKAVFIGHDFGGSIVWAMAQHHAPMCIAVVGVNTPLLYPDGPTIKLLEQAGGPVKALAMLPSDGAGHRDYVVYFQTQGDDEMNKDPRRTMLAYFRSQIDSDRAKNKESMRLGMRTNRCRLPLNESDPSGPCRGVLGLCPQDIPRDELWSEAEIDVYARAFQRTGFPLAYYRCMDANFAWDMRDKVFERKIEMPCLMVSAAYDAVLTAADAKRMGSNFNDLTLVELRCGHWTPVERPRELNAAISSFLNEKVRPIPKARAKI